MGQLWGGDMLEMLRAVWRNYVPNKVVAACQDGDKVATQVVPLLADRPSVHGRATAYVCRNYICMAPTNDPQEVARLLDGGEPVDTHLDIEETEV